MASQIHKFAITINEQIVRSDLCRSRFLAYARRCRSSLCVVHKETNERGPTNQRDRNKRNARQLLNPLLSSLGNRDAPSNAEIPKSIAEVIRSRENPQNISGKHDRIVEPFGHRNVLYRFRIPGHILLNRCGQDVVNKEEKYGHTAQSLEKEHSILGPFVLGCEVVILGSRNDEQTIDRME